MKRLIPALAALAVLSGCLGDAKEHEAALSKRENVAQKATGEFASHFRPEPLFVELTNKDGTKTTIKQPQEARATASATASERSIASGTFEESESFPMFVKLIGGAVGLAMLSAVVYGVFWVLRRSSKAVDAAISVADTKLAQSVHNLRTVRGMTTDPAQIHALTLAEAELNRARADATA